MTKPTINEIVKSARKAKGLTQQELADEAGISLRTVLRIEKGTEEISGFSLKQISIVLDIPLEEIIMHYVNQISIDDSQTGSVSYISLRYFSFLIHY
jgi:transcriptional regulator with XRE-family HTH domain